MARENSDAMGTLAREIHDAASRLRQFGRLLAGRLLGSVPSEHGGYKGLVDLWEKAAYTRAEVNALTRLVKERLHVTDAELSAAFLEEYRYLVDAEAQRWPEVRVEPGGFTVTDPEAFAARAKREGWPR